VDWVIGSSVQEGNTMVFGLFGGKQIDISIQLDRPDGAYAAGDTVVAQMSLAAEKAGPVREVRAGLVREHRYQIVDRRRDSDGDYQDNYEWRTVETWITREALAAEGELSANCAFRFGWQIPSDVAATYAGDIVKVTVDQVMARDQNEEVELKVVAPAPGVYTQPGEFCEMNNDSGAVMRFSLPTLEFVEGDTVQGRLSIEPSQSIDAREIRVELMRHEQVNPGDRTNVKQKLMQRVQVAASPKLVPGQPLTYDFALDVPAAGPPSHDVGDTVVTWLLVGTIDRPMRGDFTVSQWIGVYAR